MTASQKPAMPPAKRWMARCFCLGRSCGTVVAGLVEGRAAAVAEGAVLMAGWLGWGWVLAWSLGVLKQAGSSSRGGRSGESVRAP